MKVIFSTTYDINNYDVHTVTPAEFARLEALRGEKMWVTVGEPVHGYHTTYHGPAS